MKFGKITMCFCWALVNFSALKAQPCPVANPVTVTSTSNTAGQLNLQWAIGCINTVTVLTDISFNIPGAAPHVIQPTAALPAVFKNNAHVDGGVLNNIVIDGTSVTAGNGLSILASNVLVENLYIRDFTTGAGVWVAGTNIDVSNNRLSGNRYGIQGAAGSINNNLQATFNIIGLDNNGNPQGNTTAGIAIQDITTTAVISSNTIAFNQVGVNVVQNATNVQILSNSMYCNPGGGIVHPPIAAPVISNATPSVVSGTGLANLPIQVFSHDNTGCITGTPCQGKIFIGNTVTNGTGAWSLAISAGTLTGGDQVTATQTTNNGTSPFAACATVVCPTVSFNASVSQNVSCFGGANGSILVSGIGGGTAPFTIGWSGPVIGSGTTPSTSFTINGLVAGTYIISILDANGCISGTLSRTITQPTALALSATTTSATCFGASTGAIDLTVSGGTSPYTYDWSNDGPENPDNDTQDLSGLAAGAYTVTVTDANACTATFSATVGQPIGLALSATTTNATCFGASTGAINLTVSGGTSPYTYDWSNDGPENPDNDTQDLSGLAAGAYTVTVTDANACTATFSATVGQPTAFALSAATTNATCFGISTGAIDLTVSGGTSPYTYDWSNDGSENPDNDTQDLTGLAAGAYTVTVTDANACTATFSATVGQPTAFALSAATTNATCFGISTGAIDLTVSGGTSPYTYDWSNDGPENPDNDTQDLTGLAAGAYTVTVTDANACTATFSATVGQPTAFALSAATTNATCFGISDGAIDLTVSGGTAPYTYDWSNDGPENPDNDTQDLSGLASGAYTVTVTDANGCTAILSDTISQSTALALSATTTNAACFGAFTGAIDLTVSGGTSPYTYDWSNDGPDNPDNDPQDLAGLAAGAYTVTVTDNNACFGILDTLIAQPTPLSLAIQTIPESSQGANDGTASATAAGGVPPYTYIWSNASMGASISSLLPGEYTCTATDVNGCTVSASGIVNTVACAGFSIEIATTAVHCFGDQDGMATVQISGGIPLYAISWSTGDTTLTAVHLSTGIVSVTVTDATGCTTQEDAFIGQPTARPKPAYALYGPEEVCGNMPFTLEADDLFPNVDVNYQWLLPTGDTLYSAIPEITLVATSAAYAGVYYVVRDSLGCPSLPVGGVPIDVLSLAPASDRAGRDTVLCSVETFHLTAEPLQQGTGRWQSLGPARVLAPFSSTSLVENLQPGANPFVWKISLGDCDQATIDTVVVFVESPPVLSDDHYVIKHAYEIVVMEVLLNDHLEGLQDTVVTVVSNPSPGVLEWLPATRQFRYQIEENFRGKVQFQYQVCSEKAQCTAPCAVATVTIEVLNLPVVPEGLILHSGNDNERLLIKGIEGFSSVELTITNRWGDLVYRDLHYSNDHPWQGENARTGKPLPQGAYFYLLRAFDGDQQVGPPQIGSIHLFEQ